MTEQRKPESTLKPALRFKGFTDPWEQRRLGEVLEVMPCKEYLKAPRQGGNFRVIQQGDDPIAGYASGTPFEDFENTVVFGDHTLSLYKPK